MTGEYNWKGIRRGYFFKRTEVLRPCRLDVEASTAGFQGTAPESLPEAALCSQHFQPGRAAPGGTRQEGANDARESLQSAQRPD